MRRIDRYLLREMAVPALVGGLMVLMLLVGNQLYLLLKFLYGGAPARDVLTVLACRLPGVAITAIPASMLLGVALAINRLERDREMLACRMAGVRLPRMVAPYLLMGLLFSGIVFTVQEKVLPPMAHKAEMLTRKLLWGSPTAIAQGDQIYKVANGTCIYVHEVNPKTRTLRGLIICKAQQGRTTWLSIPYATNNDGQWTLRSDPGTGEIPRMYVFNEKGELTMYGESAADGTNWLNMNQQKDLWNALFQQPSTPDELTFTELRSLKSGVRGLGYGYTYGLAMAPRQLTFYMHRKLAVPLAALVAVLIAIPLSLHFGRSGGYVGLLLSVGVAFFFIVTQQWMQVLAETSRIHPILAAWLPDTIFGSLGLTLLMREE